MAETAKGRTVEPRGYVLIKRPDHHLADVRGYVYEHRLVAEEMLGRPLRAGEEVHHGPGGTSDNRPENLTVCGSTWEHQQYHSARPGRTRAPGEPNVLVACACGCGSLITRYDRYGRPRSFVWGHNRCEAPRQDDVLATLRDAGPLGPAEIAERCGISRGAARTVLSKMTKAGALHRVRPAVYVAAQGSDS